MSKMMEGIALLALITVLFYGGLAYIGYYIDWKLALALLCVFVGNNVFISTKYWRKK